MQLFIKTRDGKQICLNIESENRIEEIKAMIQTDGFLVFGGKELEDGFSLQDYEIEEDSVLYDIPECDGGKKEEEEEEELHNKEEGSTYPQEGKDEAPQIVQDW